MMLFDDQNKLVGGLVGDAIDSAGESIKNGIVEGVYIVLQNTFDFLIPFSFWFCKTGILLCVLVYICSKDKKATSVGVKFLFAYLLIVIIGNTI